MLIIWGVFLNPLNYVNNVKTTDKVQVEIINPTIKLSSGLLGMKTSNQSSKAIDDYLNRGHELYNALLLEGE